MTLTFSAEPDRALFATAVRHVARARFSLARLLALVVVAAGIYFWAAAGVYFFVVYVVLALVLGIVCPWLVVRRSLKLGERHFRPTEYAFGPQGFRTPTDLADSSVAWPLVAAVDDLPGQILLRLNKLQFVLVPTGGLTPQELSTLRAIIAARDTTGPGSGTPPRPADSTPGIPPRAADTGSNTAPHPADAGSSTASDPAGTDSGTAPHPAGTGFPVRPADTGPGTKLRPAVAP